MDSESRETWQTAVFQRPLSVAWSSVHGESSNLSIVGHVRRLSPAAPASKTLQQVPVTLDGCLCDAVSTSNTDVQVATRLRTVVSLRRVQVGQSPSPLVWRHHLRHTMVQNSSGRQVG